jgi:hypothetical protein
MKAGALPLAARRATTDRAKANKDLSMPQCIYCMKVKPSAAFDPEHVFSRGLCGTGANWTLTEQVCNSCNGRFSAFEAHWMRQAIEAMARNFHGPESRSEKQRFDRVQPMELDHLYIVNRDDPNVYEAGFGFPNDHHYRPQILDTPRGLLPLAASLEDGEALRDAVAALTWESVAVTIPAWHDRHSDWLIASVEPCSRAGALRLKTFSREPRPRGFG